MKKCPACAEQIQDEALKCRYCGEVLVSAEWRSYCERFATLSHEQKEQEYAKLSEEQRSSFDAAWRVLDPRLCATPPPAVQSTPAVDGQAEAPAKKASGSNPLAVGCLVVVILFTFLYILGQIGGRSRPTSSRPTKTKSEQRSPEQQTRELEVLYVQATEALKNEDYKLAEERLTKVSRRQRDYKDVADLLEHPGIKRIVDERRRKLRLQSMNSVYARRTINIRSGPGTNHYIVRQAPEGERLPAEKQEGDWVKVGTLSGDPEWVHESVVISEAEKSRRDDAALKLISWHWGTEYSYAVAEGRVKNVSGRSLENVQVVIEFKTRSGDFITAEDCLIEYNPILPGQTSPFRCGTRANPAMQTASINLKTLFGGTLSWFKD